MRMRISSGFVAKGVAAAALITPGDWLFWAGGGAARSLLSQPARRFRADLAGSARTTAGPDPRFRGADRLGAERLYGDTLYRQQGGGWTWRDAPRLREVEGLRAGGKLPASPGNGPDGRNCDGTLVPPPPPPPIEPATTPATAVPGMA
jgi:hypothetical protein